MKTKYRLKQLNDFTEPYWALDNDENSPIVTHRNIDEYECYDYDIFMRMLEECLDAPKKKLTEKEIRQDFDTNREPKLSASRVEAIKAYYNGRLELKKKVCEDIAKIDIKKMKKGFPILLKYGIPFEMNYFSCIDNDPHDKLTKMNNAYIEIEISKED